jgi:hypothetical protein
MTGPSPAGRTRRVLVFLMVQGFRVGATRGAKLGRVLGDFQMEVLGTPQSRNQNFRCSQGVRAFLRGR